MPGQIFPLLSAASLVGFFSVINFSGAILCIHVKDASAQAQIGRNYQTNIAISGRHSVNLNFNGFDPSVAAAHSCGAASISGRANHELIFEWEAPSCAHLLSSSP